MKNILFKDLPKADVHNHLHLCPSPERFFEIYPDFGFNFPKSYDGLDRMIDFILTKYNTIINSGEDIIKLYDASIKSSIDDNITYLEASIDINLSRYFDNSIDALLDETKTLIHAYKDQITFKPDIGINKNLSIDMTFEYVEACLESNIFYGLDLYGIESEQSLIPYKPVYDLVKKHGLKTKVHIGEFSNAESIKNAIELLNPQEIQHGISAVNSEYIMDMILERDIQLNICPESNLRLGAVKNLKTHPIRRLFDKGIRVTINTDDTVLFHKTVSDQFEDLLKLNVFSPEELDVIRQNAF